MKFETKCKKLGIWDEVKNIIENCELYEGNDARIVELSKLRNWEIQEEIGNYFEWIDKDGNSVEWTPFYCRISTLCKTFGIAQDKLSEVYAEAISEWGYEIAYAINEDVVLVLD